NIINNEKPITYMGNSLRKGSSGVSAYGSNFVNKLDSTIGNVFSNIHYVGPNQEVDRSFSICPYWQYNTTIPKVYFGTSLEEKIQERIYDYFDDKELGWMNYENYLIYPDNKAHGIIWKVNMNGIDTQDEFESLDPIGVGQQRFDIY